MPQNHCPRAPVAELVGFWDKEYGQKPTIWVTGALPIGPKVVPFGGSYLEFYKVIPKRSYFEAFG